MKTVISTLALILLATNLCRGESTTEAIDAVQPKLVKIFGAGGFKNLQSYGTGMIISPDGHIATVWSHVLDADVTAIVLNDGRKFYGKVVAAQPDFDLAVLKIDAENLPYFDLNKIGTPGTGTRVLGLSNMFKVATGDEPVSVLHGVIASKTKLTARRGRFEVPYRGPVYIVDAITNNPGAAGGALITTDGQLIGMIGRELRNSDSNTWINYAIPLSELREPIEAIIEGRLVEREKPIAEGADTGYVPLDFGIVLVPDVVYRTPAFVDRVVPGSKVAEFDLQPDDLIVFVNDQLVHSIRTLQEEMSKLQAEDDLTLVVRRGKELITIQMVVPRRDEESSPTK